MTDGTLSLPRLYGTREAAEALETSRPNVATIPGVSECLYPGNKDGRVAATPLYLADEIDVIADVRRHRRDVRAAAI
jgi:hypothetical protein